MNFFLVGFSVVSAYFIGKRVGRAEMIKAMEQFHRGVVK